MALKAIGALVLGVFLAGSLNESRPLEPAASYAAGKSVRVFCSSANHPLGFTAYPGATRFTVAAEVCEPLRAWQTDRAVDTYRFAFGLMVLAHEAQHSRGIWDETDATCAAIVRMPDLVRRFFPLRGRATVREIVNDARAARLSLGPVYNAHPC